MTEDIEVLLVEDNPHDLELALHALRKHRIANSIHVVTDGAAALDFLFGRGPYQGRSVNNQPRVVFLDLKLPKVDGIDVLRQLKSDERTRRIPIVVVTSSAEERDRVRSYDLGANSYVVKPIDFDSFARTMADLGFYWLAINRPPQ
jgi:CheY-like chemotaxis protein